jgi:hypothetical protein
MIFFRTNIVIHSAYIFVKVLFTAVILPNIFHILTRILFWIFAANLVGFLCKIMSVGSPPRRFRQRTMEDRAAIQAKIMDRIVIGERNIIRSDIMVPPLDNILDIIQTYNWGYLHNCACVVYTRLVKFFYANLEVVQNCSFLCWLHYVGQNHFYVMFILSQGYCFIQSLLFSYVLREDSVNFSRIYFGSLSAVRTLISQQHMSGRRDLSVRPPINV